VSALLGNLAVDHYVCLTMDAVGIINDMVGGVPLTIPEDLTAIDPSFTAGAQVVLQADEALAYVRQRSVLQDSSNAARMKRQEQYLEALFSTVLAYMESNESFSATAVSELSAHMRSNYDVGALEKTIDRLAEYERGGFYSIKGSYKVGEHMEFYPDEHELTRLLIELFYEKEQ
jgi:anionic cell wall polymer biosynthesis LytR-Cps2A-Psr (LCP) family protein